MPSSPSCRVARVIPATLVVSAILVATALVFAAVAGAATSKYPPAAASRGFSGSVADWTSSSNSAGACLAPLLCASFTNSYQETGGADGDGFIRSA